jgi:hypothetical protein
LCIGGWPKVLGAHLRALGLWRGRLAALSGLAGLTARRSAGARFGDCTLLQIVG